MQHLDMRSTFSNPNALEVLSIPGLSDYTDVHRLQLELLERRIQNEIPDTFIFCEHHPVVTRGKGLQHHLGQSRKRVELPLSAPQVIDIERGGDLTWHGPGQLVLYPIVKIKHDVSAWIRALEQSVIDLIGDFQLTGTRVPDASGVWCGAKNAENSENDKTAKKIASVGIALRHWVSYHGIALNVCNTLDGFQSIKEPCGLSSEVYGRLSDLMHIDASWRGDFERRWTQALNKVLSNP